MKARDISPVAVRMPPELKKWIQEKAQEDQRSMNFMVVQLLEKAKKIEELAA
jgi:predicted HicB family RNase H-like nuclease